MSSLDDTPSPKPMPQGTRAQPGSSAVPAPPPSRPGRKASPACQTATRADLIDAVYRSGPALSRNEAKALVETVFDEIAEALARGEPVKLNGFGRFRVRAKRARPGRNPATGDLVPIPPLRALTFKASSTLVAAINASSAAPRTPKAPRNNT